MNPHYETIPVIASKRDLSVVQERWAILQPLQLATQLLLKAPDLLYGSLTLAAQTEFWQKHRAQLLIHFCCHLDFFVLRIRPLLHVFMVCLVLFTFYVRFLSGVFNGSLVLASSASSLAKQ